MRAKYSSPVPPKLMIAWRDRTLPEMCMTSIKHNIASHTGFYIVCWYDHECAATIMHNTIQTVGWTLPPQQKLLQIYDLLWIMWRNLYGTKYPNLKLVLTSTLEDHEVCWNSKTIVPPSWSWKLWGRTIQLVEKFWTLEKIAQVEFFFQNWYKHMRRVFKMLNKKY